jgi:hypothetical protein
MQVKAASEVKICVLKLRSQPFSLLSYEKPNIQVASCSSARKAMTEMTPLWMREAV